MDRRLGLLQAHDGAAQMVLQPHPDGKDYITFGDKGRGKVVGVGSVAVSERFSLREVTFVSKLGFNLLSIRQLLDEGMEVRLRRVVLMF